MWTALCRRSRCFQQNLISFTHQHTHRLTQQVHTLFSS